MPLVPEFLSSPNVHLQHALQAVVLAAFDDLLSAPLATLALDLAKLPFPLSGDRQRGEFILDGLAHTYFCCAAMMARTMSSWAAVSAVMAFSTTERFVGLASYVA